MSSLTLKKWELRTWYLGQILEIELWAWDDGWLVSNTIDDCLQRQIAKKIFKLKIKAYWSLSALVTTWLCHAALKYCISFATDWAAKLCKLWLRTWNWFRIMMPDIVSKLLHASISSCCALWFKSEQTDTLLLGRLLILICCFAQDLIQNMQIKSMQDLIWEHFYSETKEWLEDGAKQGVLLW